MRKPIRIDINDIEEGRLSANGILVIHALNDMNDDIDRIYISVNRISSVLYMKKPTQYEKKCIKMGIDEIREQLEIAEEYGQYEFVCSAVNLFSTKRGTSIITLDPELIDRIMEMNGNRPNNLLKFYMHILWSINKKFPKGFAHKIGTETMESLAAVSGFSYETARKLFRTLEENNIIYVERCGVTVNSGEYVYKNVYSKFCDAEICRKYVNERILAEAKEDSFRYDMGMQSALAKYERLARGSGDYSRDEIQCIYNLMVRWNREKKKKGSDHHHPFRLKDLSIFEKYGIEVKEEDE